MPQMLEADELKEARSKLKAAEIEVATLETAIEERLEKEKRKVGTGKRWVRESHDRPSYSPAAFDKPRKCPFCGRTGCINPKWCIIF